MGARVLYCDCQWRPSDKLAVNGNAVQYVRIDKIYWKAFCYAFTIHSCHSGIVAMPTVRPHMPNEGKFIFHSGHLGPFSLVERRSSANEIMKGKRCAESISIYFYFYFFSFRDDETRSPFTVNGSHGRRYDGFDFANIASNIAVEHEQYQTHHRVISIRKKPSAAATAI